MNVLSAFTVSLPAKGDLHFAGRTVQFVALAFGDDCVMVCRHTSNTYIPRVHQGCTSLPILVERLQETPRVVGVFDLFGQHFAADFGTDMLDCDSGILGNVGGC